MLEVKGLRRQFGSLTAVHDLSFRLKPGDIMGFIGSNGAGKTTTIRMLATLLEPTAGTATVNGYDILRHPMDVRRQIGYMPDFFGLYDDIRVWEYLDFFANLYRLPSDQRKGVIDHVLELVDLTGKAHAFVQTLSRGMQQRLCLARCLLHDPTLLLLDEPASGLDPRARAELKELILELGRMGKIVIVSSHILPELAGFCTTIGIIERGQMVAFGPVDEVVRQSRPHRQITVRAIGEALEDVARFLESDPAVRSLRMADGRLTFEFEGSAVQQAGLLARLIHGGHQITDFHEESVNLEDAFMSLTTGAVQ